MCYPVFFSLLFLSFAVQCQEYSRVIETDSSIIRIDSSTYNITIEEKFKNSNLTYYQYRAATHPDINLMEGYRNQEEEQVGLWKSFNREGTLAYERDYDNATCYINPDVFIYYKDVLEMKAKADSLIKLLYSEEFFKNNVRFNFDADFSLNNGIYLGHWLVPINQKPEKYEYRYDVKVTSEWFDELIKVTLDSTGNYNAMYGTSSCQFEEVKSENPVFQINLASAIESAKAHGLEVTDDSKISETLKWKKQYGELPYNGQFEYYIVDVIEIIEIEKTVFDFREDHLLDVYYFNPWTGEFLEKKQMINFKYSKYDHYGRGLLMPYNRQN